MTGIPSPHVVELTGGPVRLDAVRPTGFDAAAVEQFTVPIALHGLEILRRDVSVGDALPDLHPSGHPVDESYTIGITTERIVVEAASDEGAFRALTTVAQAAETGSLRLGTIRDAPRFGWRGLSLDVARTPLPLDELRRIVDILASLKLNVLHLHLTDDQGWRMPVDARPELARIGGAMAMNGRDGFAYSSTEYSEFERWSRDRHVWIVPEIGLPGHVGALLATYPDLAAGCGTPGEYASRLHLQPNSDAVYEVLADVLAAAAGLHSTPYIHLGGDEAFGMADDEYARVLSRAIEAAGLDPQRVIAWQEAVRAGVGIRNFQVWRDLDRVGLVTDPEVRRRLGLLAAADLDELTVRGREDVARIGAEGRTAILSPMLVAYLDRAYDDPAVHDEGLDGVGMPVYLPRSVRDSFEFDVETVVPGLDPQSLAGFEAALWTETIGDAETAERMLLPRLAGIAQRAWEHEPTEWRSHVERLRRLEPLWDARGFHYFRAAEVYGRRRTADTG